MDQGNNIRECGVLENAVPECSVLENSVQECAAQETFAQGKDTKRKLIFGILAVIVLALCLCITTFALLYAMVSVENNLFYTGSVEMNLNDGKPVIEEHEFLFEPGMTVKKEFFIENKSTWDVYYRLYFDNVDGGLADVLDITIMDGDTVLYSGKMTELTRQTVGAADEILKVQERRELTVYFHFPEESGNGTQNLTLAFDLCADAVQTKNNPDREFD